MTDVTARSSWYLDLQIPSILRRGSDRFRPVPLRVPELASSPPPPRAIEPVGEPVKGGEHSILAADVDRLKSQAAGLRQDRDVLRAELVDLNRQIPALRRQRDELVAETTPLRSELAALQSRHDELAVLRSEIQSLRRRRSTLEKAISGLRRSSESERWGKSHPQKFHDS